MRRIGASPVAGCRTGTVMRAGTFPIAGSWTGAVWSGSAPISGRRSARTRARRRCPERRRYEQHEHPEKRFFHDFFPFFCQGLVSAGSLSPFNDAFWSVSAPEFPVQIIDGIHNHAGSSGYQEDILSLAASIVGTDVGPWLEGEKYYSQNKFVKY